MSMRRLIKRLEEAKNSEYDTIMAAIADRVTRKGPKGIYYALDDLLREAFKDKKWKQSVVVKVIKDIAAVDDLAELSLSTGEAMPTFRTGFMKHSMPKYIEAAQNGYAETKNTPEEDAATERMAEIAKAKADWAVLGKRVGLFGK
jgi:hypothetical protein